MIPEGKSSPPFEKGRTGGISGKAWLNKLKWDNRVNYWYFLPVLTSIRNSGNMRF
jgi:hypothetical protein